MPSEERSTEWAFELMALLDEIEAVAGNRSKVLKLTGARFDIAHKHGMKVTFVGETTDARQ
jgi:hypothetical protein